MKTATRIAETAPAPPAVRAPRRRIAGPAAIALAAAVPPLWLALEDGGYDPVLRQELAVAVWAAIAAGLAAGFVPRSRPDRWLFAAAAAAGALIAWTALSLAWTESVERTLAELARLTGYLGFAVLAVLGLTRTTFRAAAAGVSVAAVAIAGLALISRLFPDLFPGADEVSAVFRVDRLTFPLDYWNAVGAWCAMAVAIGLAWSAHARRPAIRALALAGVPVSALGVYLTYSRAGTVATAVAVLAVLALSRHRWTALLHTLAAGCGTALVILVVRDNPEIADATGGEGGLAVFAALVVAALLCAAAVAASDSAATDRYRLPRRHLRQARVAVAGAAVAVLILASGPLASAWSDFRTEEEVGSGADPASRLAGGGGNRDELWGSALAAFSAHPLAGTGAGTFEFWWSRDARDTEYVRDAHSLYIEHLAELGLPGLLVLLALIGCLLGAAIRARRRLRRSEDAGASTAMIAAFAVFCTSAAVDWQWEVGAVAVLGLLCGAIAAAAGTPPPARPGRGPLAARPGLQAVGVTLAVGALAIQVPGLVATEQVRASQAAARDGDLERAGELAADAVAAEPWAATPLEQLALVQEAEGDYGPAEETIRAAMRREPTNWRLPLVLARVQAADGRRAAAKRTFLSHRSLRPLGGYYSPFGPIGRAIYTDEELRRIAATGSIRAGGGFGGGP